MVDDLRHELPFDAHPVGHDLVWMTYDPVGDGSLERRRGWAVVAAIISCVITVVFLPVFIGKYAFLMLPAWLLAPAAMERWTGHSGAESWWWIRLGRGGLTVGTRRHAWGAPIDAAVLAQTESTVFRVLLEELESIDVGSNGVTVTATDGRRWWLDMPRVGSLRRREWAVEVMAMVERVRAGMEPVTADRARVEALVSKRTELR